MSSNALNGILRHIELLQEVHRTIPGVTDAPSAVEDYPADEIPDSKLPFVMVLPGVAEWRMESMNGLDRVDRQYLVRVFVAGLGDGITGESMYDGLELMQRFGQTYLARNTQLLQGMDNTEGKNQISLRASADVPVTDNGWEAQMLYGSGVYSGFEFTVTVYEKGANDGTGW